MLISVEFDYSDLTVELVAHIPTTMSDRETHFAASPVRYPDNLLQGELEFGLDEIAVVFVGAGTAILPIAIAQSLQADGVPERPTDFSQMGKLDLRLLGHDADVAPPLQ